MSDDLLGQHQDDIIRLRFDLERAKEQLERAKEQTDAFDGCNTLFDFCSRMVELGNEPGMRTELQQGLIRIRHSFDAAPWVERLAQAVQAKDETAFDKIYQDAITAAVVSK